MSEPRQQVILFHSEVSAQSWPEAIQRALPEFEVKRNLEGVAPEDVVAAVVWKHPPGMLKPLHNLRLIQVLGAGVDHFFSDNQLPEGVPIARLVDPGLTARMTEYVLLHVLSLHRRSHESASAQREHRWEFIYPDPPERTCVGILGLGRLGSACATTLSGLGFRVIGWSRSRKENVPFKTYAGIPELPEFKRQCDILVLLLPLTSETRDLVDEEFLRDVREGAAIVNVARGDLVVDQDLVDALDSGRLRHAVLDVFRQEPLPVEHAFWTHPKIAITPHNSSATNPETAVRQVADNIRRAMAGQMPSNIVDPLVGY